MMRYARAALAGVLLVPASAAMAAPTARAHDAAADCSTAEIPDEPFAGSIAGIPFTLSDAEIGPNGTTGINGVDYDAYLLMLTLNDAQDRRAEITVTVIVAQGALPDGRGFRALAQEYGQPEAGPGAPEVQGWGLDSEALGIDASFVFDVASLRLELGERDGGVLPVRLIFCAPDIEQTSFGGTFEAPLYE